mgnify:CR=1 FL=1
MLLTQEFLTLANVCEAGQKCADDGNYIGVEYDEVIKDLLRRDLKEDAGWLQQQKSTELYVRMNGSQFTMGAYQVFNPLTGQHTRYETEAEAKAALVEVGKQLLVQYCPQVIQELSNENGDTTWIPTTMNQTLTIS